MLVRRRGGGTELLEQTRAIWTNVVLAVCVVMTALTGFVVGYGVVWFQIGGAPDAEDYLISAGGYAAAAALLAVALPALVAFRGPRWLVFGSSWISAMYVVLAVRSALLAAGAEDPGPGINTALDGIGGVGLMPWAWAWALLALGTAGTWRLVRGGVREPTRRSPSPT